MQRWKLLVSDELTCDGNIYNHVVEKDYCCACRLNPLHETLSNRNFSLCSLSFFPSERKSMNSSISWKKNSSFTIIFLNNVPHHSWIDYHYITLMSMIVALAHWCSQLFFFDSYGSFTTHWSRIYKTGGEWENIPFEATRYYQRSWYEYCETCHGSPTNKIRSISSWLFEEWEVHIIFYFRCLQSLQYCPLNASKYSIYCQ